MHLGITALTFGILLAINNPVRAGELCGEEPALSDPAIARKAKEAAKAFKISAAARKTFADLAANFHEGIAREHPPGNARVIAVAMLHEACVELTRGEDPAKLPPHVKDKLVGLSMLVPDFEEARALLERIRAAEKR
jgi:hypothetical protein